ncbi:MAG: sigma-E processing peptidase SpoIIGA [Firmicutes bacterium]|nr:sigma-E processing peptidase SpoIIGA [Bacillota bacterium]
MAAVYVETFILKNTIVDAGLLWLAAAWRGGQVKPFRILFGAALGSAWALVAAMAGGPLSSALAGGVISLLMAWVGVGGRAHVETVKSACALWFGAAVLGGVMALGLSLLLAGTLTGAAGVALVRRKRMPLSPAVTLSIFKGDVARKMEAMVDTGNRALDPWTGLPVIFVQEGVFCVAERVLSIRTAAGMRTLPCFEPDHVTVDGNPVRAMVAVVPRGLLDRALVPWVLCAQREAS